MRIALLLWLALSLAVCSLLGVVHSRNAAALQRARSTLEKTFNAALHESAELSRQLVQTRAILDATHARLATAQALLSIRTAQHPSPSTLTPAQRKRVEQHPENARFRIRQTRQFAERIYGDFIHSAGLSTEKSKQLRALIVEKMLSTQDAHNLIEAQSLQPGNPAATRTLMRLQSEIDDDIYELLGPKLFHRYKYAPSDRMLIDSSIRYFEARLADHALQTLDDTQREALRHAYREASHPHVPGKERNQVLGSEYNDTERFGAPRDAKIEQLVAKVLSPEQLTALTSYHHDYRTQTGIRERVEKIVREETSSQPQ